jgi:serine/threonine-protein kinase HipA
MARSRSFAPLNIYLNGRHVGQLNRSTNGAISFQYADVWLKWEHTLPVSLSLPLREQRYTGAAVSAVFENLLPDNRDIRARLAGRKHADGIDAFSLLSKVGRDCVGALQFLPEGEEPQAVGNIDGREVSDAEIAAILADLSANPLGLGDDEEFRISIAGAQEKTALLFNAGKWMIPHGTTATTHILKPPIGIRNDGIDLSLSAENEHFCLTLLGNLGLPVAKTEVVIFEDRKALVVERFDRQLTKDGRLIRVPQEDFCQALSVSPDLKYEKDGGPGYQAIAGLLQGSDDPTHDQMLLMKTMVLFWLLAASDGHAKNFSVFLNPGGGYRMTPIYDVMSVQPVFDAGQLRQNRVRLAMVVGEHRHYRIDEIVPRHFFETAKLCGIGESIIKQLIAEIIAQSPAAIAATRSDMSKTFPVDLLNSILGGYEARLKFLADAET